MPEDLIYRSYSNSGRFIKTDNPITMAIQLDVFNYELIQKVKENTKLITSIYRDTVHYAINGLVSNTSHTQFRNRECVVIEPLKDHINSRLVNINPVDSIIDIGEKGEPIKENAIFIFSKHYFEKLSEKLKEKIDHNKKYLYDQKSFDDNNSGIMLEVITDLVLCHNGIIPQHSHGQKSLWIEYFTDYDSESDEEIEYSDEKYLKMLRDLIDKISINKFGISYYNKNSVGTLGILHVDTKYYVDEQIKSIEYQEDMLLRYIDFIKVDFSLPEELVSIIKERIYKFANNSKVQAIFPISRSTFVKKDEIKNYINKYNLSKFIIKTEEFNELERRKLDNIRMINESNGGLLNDYSYSKCLKQTLYSKNLFEQLSKIE